ncbi:MAG: hypothetical protein ACI9RM_001755 [Ulvibacter sp.]|jgi:hypothetical protein
MEKVTSKGADKEEKKEKKEKDNYRVTNWSSYNKSLVGRGDITLWIDESVMESWYYEGPDQRSSQYLYSDNCIEILLQPKAGNSSRTHIISSFFTPLLKSGYQDLFFSNITKCRKS